MNTLSVSIPNELKYELESEANRAGISVSEYVRAAISKVIQRTKYERASKAYEVFMKSKGSGSDQVTDASTRVDDLLYGPDGTWKGSNE